MPRVGHHYTRQVASWSSKSNKEIEGSVRVELIAIGDVSAERQRSQSAAAPVQNRA